ncbi:MAG: hypothetical protein P4L35_01835 [Ignavibacteriaceae bacterium]|nr:hypothetical protein [Ignavibacteriaceae bacterium]
MDIVKQYLVQCISSAANNLRLNSQKIEIVAMLRDIIVKSNDLDDDIRLMKKITELSTLAIRLTEIYSYLSQPQIDLFKFSDKIKEHSSLLIKDMSHMLDVVSPETFKHAIEKIRPPVVEENKIIAFPAIEPMSNSIRVDLSKRKPDVDIFVKPENEIIKEKIIMEEENENEDLFFQNYESEILKPIKLIDSLLKQISSNEINEDEIDRWAKLMKTNGDLSARIGFEIIANMHRILSRAFTMIGSKELVPKPDVIESMRASLIVIVAVIKGKEVDITNYLNRAEEFGRKIQILN